MKNINILLIVVILMLTGCASREPIIRTEYVKVEVPVVYKLKRPPRPEFNNKSVPGYISEMVDYINTLESIIDEHN